MSTEIAATLSRIESKLSSLREDVDALKDGRERDLGAKSPDLGASSDLPTLGNVEDEVTTELSWAEKMELESGEASDRLRPVKVGEATEAILQQAFTPLKNADRLTLQRQFLVPDLPITMAPKLDKVMGAECQSGVKSTDTALARLQALALDAVGPLTSLLEKMASSGESSDDAMDLEIVEDAVQAALVLLGNASTQFSLYRRTKILEDFNKDLISFAEEKEPELRTAASQLFGSAFTKQAAEHLEQVEMLRKTKAKGRKVFSRPPLQRQARWQGGSRPYSRPGSGHRQQFKGTSGATPKKFK